MNKTFFETDQLVRPTDPEAISKLVRATGVFTESEAWTAAELATCVLDGTDLSYQFIFLRTKNGEIVAYSCFGEIPLAPNRYDLYWILVHPEYQRLGLAKKIIEETERAVITLGGKHIYAETSSTERYHPARSFYLKNQFDIVANYPDFYMQGDDKVVFVKKFLNS